MLNREPDCASCSSGSSPLTPLWLFPALHAFRGECRTDHAIGTSARASANGSRALTAVGPLFGRDSESVMLARLMREVAGGRGGSVLIEGEPGIGKSALVRAALAEGIDAGCQVFWGAGDELGQALPLLPLLDALRVREPSPDPRRTMIARVLRGELTVGQGADVQATLAEQLLALVAELCAHGAYGAGRR